MTRRAIFWTTVPVFVMICACQAIAGVKNLPGDETVPLELGAQIGPVWKALISLPAAALFGSALAFRPRRSGTPPRSAPVIQTQMILALVGAVVMLVVGASLARAFGIVGAAGLVRYRAKIEDPKDAGVMLSALAVGLASGAGLYLLGGIATLFILGTLWVIESFEPEHGRIFELKIATNRNDNARTQVEAVLRRQHIPFELRSTSEGQVCYEVQLALGKDTDRLSSALLDRAHAVAVEWEQKKKKEP